MSLTRNREARDPLARKRVHHVPPGLRSQAAHALSARAARGAFELQSCRDCRTATWPPRDICPVCWGELGWTAQPAGATLVAETTIRVTTDPYFRDHLPWRIGTVALDAGPMAIAHLHGALGVGDRAVLRLMLDRGGNAALFAIPEGALDVTDRQWRQFVVPIEGRTILVTDGASATGQAVVAALAAAGAGTIVAGMPPPARAVPAGALPHGVLAVPLDLTDAGSLKRCLTLVPGPLDIVVNTARHVRTGGAGPVELARMLDVAVIGLTRLIAATAPMLAGRPAGAFVDLLSIEALVPGPGAAFAAAEAARHALVRSLRDEMRDAGVRVLSVFAGPIEDEDHQSAPLPRLAPARLAKGVVDALANGREQSAVGDIAEDGMARWLADPALYEREKNR